jgi:hypothetical protein
LEAALYGYQVEKEKIEVKIRELQAQLRGKNTPAAGEKPVRAGARRQMSAAARARIAAAQKKRWAEYHKNQAATGTGA